MHFIIQIKSFLLQTSRKYFFFTLSAGGREQAFSLLKDLD